MSDLKLRRANAVTPLGGEAGSTESAAEPGDQKTSVKMDFHEVQFGDATAQHGERCEKIELTSTCESKAIKNGVFLNDKLLDNHGHEKTEDIKTEKLLHYSIPEKLHFYEAMGPMIKMMMIFGLWHAHHLDPRYYKGSVRQLDRESKTAVRRIFNARNYCILVNVLLWFNFLRFVPAFFVGPEQAMLEERLFFKVIYCLFTFQCACNTTTLFFASEKMHRMPRFFHHWEDRIQRNSAAGVNLKHVRRWSVIFTVQAIVFVVFHFLNQSFGVFGNIEMVRNASAVFVAPFPEHPVLHIVFIVINIYDFAAWIFPILLFIHICMILCNRFGDFTKRLDRAILRAYTQRGLPANMEDLRYQHQELCLAVEHSNQGLFTYTNAISYGTMLPLACFLLYQLLFSTSYRGNVSAILMYVVWLTSIFVNIPVVSWIAAIVNTRAHKPINMMYNVRVADIKSDELMVMSMFLSRLNGVAVGYTVFDLVTLTKPFILTMGGLGVTYFALLAEFEK